MAGRLDLQQKIALGFALSICSVLLLTGVTLLMLHRGVLQQSTTRFAVATVQILETVTNASDAEPPHLQEVMEHLLDSSPDCEGLAVFRNGTPLAASGQRFDPPAVASSARTSGAPVEIENAMGDLMVVVEVPDSGLVIAGRFSHRSVDRALLMSGLVVAGSMLIGLVLAVIVARRLAANRAHELENLRQVVRRISQGHLSQRVEVSEESELTDLSTAINTMARQLESSHGDLQSAYSELARLDEIKADMLATVSHELRTPLTALRGYLGLLSVGRMGPMSSDVINAVNVCQANVERLSRRVDEIVQIIDMEHRRPESVDEIDLKELLSGVLEVFVPRIEEKGIEARLEVQGTHVEVWGRYDELERVFLNLLDNAVKFTPRGGSITVEGRRQTREEQEGVLVVVTDSGPGIEPVEQLRVFDRFYQVDPSSRRRHGGMGLGLAVVRSTVERHGGAVWLESHPGVGSAFFVWLPEETQHTEAGAMQAPASVS